MSYNLLFKGNHRQLPQSIYDTFAKTARFCNYYISSLSFVSVSSFFSSIGLLRFCDLLYLSRVHIPIQETIFSVPLKWHCSFHKNLNGATLGVIPSSFNLLLFLRITGFFWPVCWMLDSTASAPPRKNFISKLTA